MSDRLKLLSKLDAGDIFHASSPNLPSLICLVTSVSSTIISARTVTTQLELEFDRHTGVELPAKHSPPCLIDSVTPLPVDVYNIILGIDRKFRLESEEDRLKLDEAEVQALIFIATHYPANLL